MPTATGDCTCPTCVIASPTLESSDYEDGFPGYNYGKNNTFLFKPGDLSFLAVCLSYVQLELYYGPSMPLSFFLFIEISFSYSNSNMFILANYSVLALVPNSGPPSGGIYVYVVGENFVEDEPVCAYVSLPVLID